MGDNRQLNDALRALAGRPVEREEQQTPETPRFAAGSADGGAQGTPIQAPGNDAINRAFRDAADRLRVRREMIWEKVW